MDSKLNLKAFLKSEGIKNQTPWDTNEVTQIIE